MKIFLNTLRDEPDKEWFDLRSAEEASFVYGLDKEERSRVRLAITMQTAEELKAEKSQIEVRCVPAPGFVGMSFPPPPLSPPSY